jgi:hypothetical protein
MQHGLKKLTFTPAILPLITNNNNSTSRRFLFSIHLSSIPQYATICHRYRMPELLPGTSRNQHLKFPRIPVIYSLKDACNFHEI